MSEEFKVEGMPLEVAERKIVNLKLVKKSLEDKESIKIIDGFITKLSKQKVSIKDTIKTRKAALKKVVKKAK